MSLNVRVPTDGSDPAVEAVTLAADMDGRLDSVRHIVPGIGDAGDRLYGT